MYGLHDCLLLTEKLPEPLIVKWYQSWVTGETGARVQYLDKVLLDIAHKKGLML